MSANNYRICPKCQAAEASRCEAARVKADKAYGVVTPAEFDALRAEAVPRELEETLAEYYELGIRRGQFSVNYSAGCQTCGFRFKFEAKPVPVGT